MRISKRTRYGVRLMLELALHYRNKPLSVSQIAESEELSPKFLSQIIIPLKGAGLIQSTRGAQGGYELSRPPKKISLLEVFRILEGDCLLTECIQDPKECGRAPHCVTRDVWEDMTKTIEAKLQSVTFEELAERSRERAEKASPIFQI
ncbi:MAG: Rrf2 family transcriptional regulator [Spirochaetales bacterium]|nr:Rrf2 family transcriptional regulator [Spirochaetales bacterium]